MKIVKRIKPLGHRVLVAPDNIETKTKGGIILVDETARQERQAQVIGTVLDIGDTCWADSPTGEPWCKIGDRVVFAKYAGMKIWNPIEGKYREDMLLLNDLDLTAIITEEEDIYD